jgi:hypothetical protein
VSISCTRSRASSAAAAAAGSSSNSGKAINYLHNEVGAERVK